VTRQIRTSMVPDEDLLALFSVHSQVSAALVQFRGCEVSELWELFRRVLR
jgi:hypothetical protein